RGLGDGDALAEHVAADLRLRIQQPRGGAAWRIDSRLDGVEHPVDLRHAVDADRGRAVKPLTLRGQVTDRRDRVPADDQRPHVRGAPQALGKHLRPAVEPDRNPAAIQRPAVAWVDDGTTAGRHDACDAGRQVGSAEVEDGSALLRAEGGLTILLEDLRDAPPSARLDLLVEVDERDMVALREASSDDGLA